MGPTPRREPLPSSLAATSLHDTTLLDVASAGATVGSSWRAIAKGPSREEGDGTGWRVLGCGCSGRARGAGGEGCRCGVDIVDWPVHVERQRSSFSMPMAMRFLHSRIAIDAGGGVMKAAILAAAAGLVGTVLGCPDHDFHGMQERLQKRMESPGGTGNSVKWVYEESNRWGYLADDFALCQMGTQQSPIDLRLSGGISHQHCLKFNYTNTVTGSLHNWGYGPSMNFDHPKGKYTCLPSMTFQEKPGAANETVYLTGWHIHAPADHTVEGHRSRAEMHFVHVDAKGKPRAVLAFRIDPGTCDSKSDFLLSLPELVHCKDLKTQKKVKNFMPKSVLAEVGWFHEFWTYKGSLTSPPCTEGIRWFVARNVLYVGDKQMQDILFHSKFASRETQEIWRHQVNV
ncbi:hypothetical protein Dda_8999 [Drechslerella dactyloides]|uniref:Alpha-carbonic anhydrase domain-containing protein n=1 Tax=Drechslerella dactyloides TaxID=74499 RepID=A0AAD6NFG8_DREDA|nr:hypothetical protein Dda_8999 [Drechslerella dactyloides]